MFYHMRKTAALYGINLTLIALCFFLSLCFSCNDNKRVENLDVALKSIDGNTVVPRNANKIIIPFFRDMSAEPSITQRLTIQLREQINLDGRLTVVANNEDADLRLSGIIVKYEIQPVQYSTFGEPVRNRMRLIASVKLYDLKKEKEIFYDSEIQAFEVYSDVIPPIITETQAQDMVIDSLARRISNKTVNGWYTDLMTPVEKGKK